MHKPEDILKFPNLKIKHIKNPNVILILHTSLVQSPWALSIHLAMFLSIFRNCLIVSKVINHPKAGLPAETCRLQHGTKMQGPNI